MARKFKFLRTGLKSNYDGFQWEVGVWHKTNCTKLRYGFNCSEKIIDALRYVQGEILAEVEVRGKKFVGDDKSTHSEMRIIKTWDWTREDSVALAIFAAELVVEIFEAAYPNDPRPRNAIGAAKEWLENPSKAASEAAWAAASEAASAASEAASAAASEAASEAVLNKIEEWIIKYIERKG